MAPDASGSFARLDPPGTPSPLVITVAHAGRIYPPALLAASAVPPRTLEELEDRHADLLAGPAVAGGATAIVARVARAWIDLNRGPGDLDPDLRDPPDSGPPATRRARSGLGLLPRRLGAVELWRAAPTPADAAARIATVHAPFHEAAAAALERARRRHGFAVLLDCHSMPPLRGMRAARVVIGDRHGAAAGPGIAAALVRFVGERGHAAALNAPYAGAYTLARHGRPADDVHAVQVELDRTLYLAPDLRAPGRGLETIARLVAEIGARAVDLARPARAIAAE